MRVQHSIAQHSNLLCNNPKIRLMRLQLPAHGAPAKSLGALDVLEHFTARIHKQDKHTCTARRPLRASSAAQRASSTAMRSWPASSDSRDSSYKPTGR